MKIAIGIPSLNEKDNIRSITIKIDEALSFYQDSYDVVIVNCDNNSSDGTNDIFTSTLTKCRKDSIITSDIGKGNNLLAFFQYCLNHQIDYAITIDADVTSFDKSWISKFLNPLFEGYDFVSPIYKRSRFEGSTTNHFAFPLMFAITGEYMRQPIAGDFSFDKNFLELILKQPVNDSIRHYGIDIFMSLTAVCNHLKTTTILLDKKLHNPSFHKMEGMFHEVMSAFLFTWKNYSYSYSIPSFPCNLEVQEDSIISSLNFKHESYAKEKYSYYKDKIGDVDIEKEWLKILYQIVVSPDEITDDMQEKIFSFFMVRATYYWLNASKMSSCQCEKVILDQAMNLRKIVLGGL